MSLIGTEIAKMHMADIIHGDLTTSNMMLRYVSSPPTSTRSQVQPQTDLVRLPIIP
jgi:TP53 regulating kinase and related kinases